jgi:hypothetical protein
METDVNVEDAYSILRAAHRGKFGDVEAVKEALGRIISIASLPVAKTLPYPPKKVPDALADLGAIYRERHKLYGETDKSFGRVMAALLPGTTSLSTPADWSRFALLAHVVDKLGRYATSFSSGGHVDSLDDISVYAQMLQEYDGELRSAVSGQTEIASGTSAADLGVNAEPRPRQIIGLAGKIGCGKSTAAACLVDEMGFLRLRFAGALKEMMRCLGLKEEDVDGSRKNTPSEILGGRTPREAMQSLGTEWGRDLVSPTLWLDVVKRQVADASDRSVVIDDVRFPNEAIAIREMGGVVVRIDRPELETIVPRRSREDHVSEAVSFQVDHVILNDSTLEDFLADVRALPELKYDPDGGVRVDWNQFKRAPGDCP